MIKKLFLLVCCFVNLTNVHSLTNLAATAIVIATSTNTSYPIANVKDGNVSTKWQSSGNSTQTLTFTLANTLRFATITVTNITAIGGFTIQLSVDNITWTSAATYSASTPVTVTKTNLYICNSNQFVPYKYIRLQMVANQGFASVYEVAITEDPTLFASFTSSPYNLSNQPLYALDCNANTTFSNYNVGAPTNILLKIQLSSSLIKAMNVNVNSSNSGLRVDITDINGNTTMGYYYTLVANDNFIVVNPAGIKSITVTSDNTSTINIIDVALSEISLNTVSMTFGYDATGNMTSRTINFSTSKSAHQDMQDTIIPLALNLEKETPYKDDFGAKNVLVYPNPTRGNLTFEFNNLKAEDKAKVQLFTVNGRRIIDKAVTANLSNIDLLGEPNGTYILNILINSDVHTWTIIKQ